jgi:hypothetical protein
VRWSPRSPTGCRATWPIRPAAPGVRALAELERLWTLVAELAAERVRAPERIDAVALGRIQRAIFLARVVELFGGLLPRLGWALLTYTGLRGVAR